MTITGTNHGLSVHTTDDAETGADTTDNRRLRRPVPVPEIVTDPVAGKPEHDVTNSFNDATSVFAHHGIYGDLGHEGIDFRCVGGTQVRAMYGGVVIETRTNWQPSDGPSGRYVKTRSCTDWEDRSGFEHAYLHLESVDVAVGQSVTKDHVIGRSGDTGTPNSFHLHVHLRPFNCKGKVPSPRENSAMPSGWALGDPLPPPVRVRGSMNFDCFLVNNPDGRWTVWKSGKTVTAIFNSPRSPVQYYARQNPQPQFVLPADLRPASQVPHTVTGTRVQKDRTPVPNAQPAIFDMTIGTNGEVRYVDNAKVDDLGYVNYRVQLTWQTNEAREMLPTSEMGETSESDTDRDQ